MKGRYFPGAGFGATAAVLMGAIIILFNLPQVLQQKTGNNYIIETAALVIPIIVPLTTGSPIFRKMENRLGYDRALALDKLLLYVSIGAVMFYVCCIYDR